MILSDTAIRRAIKNGQIDITRTKGGPVDIQPASVDLHLGNCVRVFSPVTGQITSPFSPHHEDYPPIDLADNEGWAITPGAFILGSTLETVSLSRHFAARFEGKSSLGRMGLMTHVTAGFIDPGFCGQITVELVNVTSRPIALVPGMAIGQICFMPVSGRVSAPYGSETAGSHYQGQTGPTPPRGIRILPGFGVTSGAPVSNGETDFCE